MVTLHASDPAPGIFFTPPASYSRTQQSNGRHSEQGGGGATGDRLMVASESIEILEQFKEVKQSSGSIQGHVGKTNGERCRDQ